MRVLFWSGTFWPHIGGVEVLAARLLSALRERGYEFVVVSSQSNPGLPAEASYKEIPVHRFPFALGHNDVDQLSKLRQQIAELKRTFAPDLIHIHVLGVGVLFHLMTTNAHSAPVLLTLHGQWQAQQNALVERTLRNADWIIGSSEAILLCGQRLVPEIISRSSLICNALEAPALLPEPLPLNPPQLLCLGRLVVYKGFDLALTAFASIVERFPQARLLIAGDGPQRSELEQQAVNLGLTHAVEFLGWVAPENVPALINTATLVVLPSWGEGLSVVALEAALMARPLVATRVGGLPEVVTHGQTGLLVERGNPSALAEAIVTLLEQAEMAAQMGQAARRQVLEKFNWTRYVDAYDTRYRKLAQGAREK